MAKRPRIDTSDLPFGKPKKIIDEDHTQGFIKRLPCCVTLAPFAVDPAHITFKGSDAGMGTKASDKYVVPLTRKMHTLQHSLGHPRFWLKYGGIERALQLAEDLYLVSGDGEAGKKLIWEFFDETNPLTDRYRH